MAFTCNPSTFPSPSYTRLPGALDITEEVGAAVGIPHVAKIWEEVHRSHQLNRHLTRPSRSHTQTPIIEEPEEEEGQSGSLPHLLSSLYYMAGSGWPGG